ncbi:hypothetical protein L1987_75657 [Smallanthus sonchifolius]|uniref:Uncharacterized protein n=1 Tax=Smallanthus sonchifolius TaxID=185202 RepID=A0ACB9A750_9ASTR|nr:hypothetical protein L1987_75657 [Smallanthus sonchifolius]
MQPIKCLLFSSHVHFLFYSLTIFLASTAVLAGNETDYQALLKIKSMITDPYGALTSSNSSLHFCDWNGVYCGKRHRRVILLVVQSQGLEGLYRNGLVGSIPKEIGFLSKLTYLGIGDNRLTGGIPPVLTNITSMESFSLTGNPLGGSIPNTLGHWKNLSEFHCGLGDNIFGSNEADEMKFIDSLENCTRLEILSLDSCNFQGVLPTSIGNLSNQVKYLSIKENQLHGSLPRSIGNLVGLTTLSLAGNRFTGNIPSTIGKLQKLQALFLDKNQLSGQIPDVIGNLSSLISLFLSTNMLERVIPSSLGNCQRLLELYLNDNNLNGEIPTQLLQLSSLSINLDLSRNNLIGSLPTEVGDLKMLSALYLSDNNLSGNVPSSLGGCTSLSWLSLKGNRFQGMIPPSFISLKGLVKLDISHNNLSGQIPQFLERLQYLNLSYNDFEGEVPMLGVFTNESAFSVSGNSRLCGGFVELGLPKCTEIRKHKKNFPMFVTVIFIASTLLAIICLAYVWCKKKRKRQPTQVSTSDRFLKVSYSQLLKATNGFSEANLIGNGGFRFVYKGILDENDDRFVAVKVLHLQNRGAQRSFMRECKAWQNIRHRNLLRIITSCSSMDFHGNDFKALVYEFMPKGSLHDWLHSSEEYGLGNEMTISGDVYSFGILLLEAMTGKRPTDDIFNEDISLHEFAFMALPEHVMDVIDVNILNVYQEDEMFMKNKEENVKKIDECLASIVKIGVSCTMDYPPERIDLKKVMTGKKPTDDMFNEDLCLHKFASMALRDHVTVSKSIMYSISFLINKGGKICNWETGQKQSDQTPHPFSSSSSSFATIAMPPSPHHPHRTHVRV